MCVPPVAVATTNHLMTEATIPLTHPQRVLTLFGARDQHLHAIRDTLGVAVVHRDGHLRVTGEESAVVRATQVLEQMQSHLGSSDDLSGEVVADFLARAQGKRTLVAGPPIDVVNVSKRISPRTAGQARYVQAIRESDITFAIGPAGTGKTYLAVAVAVEALKQHQIRKIVLVRPAVDAGESLGFLPGDMHAKINPYLRPLLDSLADMVDYDLMKRYMETDVVEIAPLAYMRGRTLNEAFIILDEAQNTTPEQMKMFLTRIGIGAKAVVTGDVTQIDLQRGQKSGLIEARQILRDVRGIAFTEFQKEDVVRHPLVARIVSAYEAHTAALEAKLNDK